MSTSKEHIYGIGNSMATELIQRVMNGEFTMTEAFSVTAVVPLFMLYRTLPKDIVEKSEEQHYKLVEELVDVINNYIKKEGMNEHELINCLSQTTNSFLSNK